MMIIFRPFQGRNVRGERTWGAARYCSLYPTLLTLSPSGTDVGLFRLPFMHPDPRLCLVVEAKPPWILVSLGKAQPFRSSWRRSRGETITDCASH